MRSVLPSGTSGPCLLRSRRSTSAGRHRTAIRSSPISISICEFGTSHPDLAEIHAALGAPLRSSIADRIRDAQQEGDAVNDLEPEIVADFLIANIAGLRVAGRGGADRATLAGFAIMALRTLR
jgi:hypothetical protein